MSTIAIAADLHLNNNTYGRQTSGGLPLKVKDAFAALDFVVNTSIQKKVDELIVVGDIFDHPSPTCDIERMLNERLQRLVDAGIQIRLMVGNHDLCQKYHALQPLKGWNEKLRVVENFGVETRKDITLAYVPHSSDIETKKETFKGYIEKLKKAKLAEKGRQVLFFGHFPVCGAYQNDSNRNDETRNVSVEDLTSLGYEVCFLGDFHKRQYLSKNPRVLYVGSTERKDFNEASQEKGFCIYDTVTREIEWFNYAAREMIEIRGDDFASIQIALSETDVKDAIVKIRVTGNDDQYAHVQQRFSDLSASMKSKGTAFFVGLEKPAKKHEVEDQGPAVELTGNENVFTLIEDSIRSASNSDCSPAELSARLSLLKEIRDEVASNTSLVSHSATSGKNVMRFKWLRLNNFCRFGETNNFIDFDNLFKGVEGDMAGVVSITGATDGDEDEANAVGKSTILESIAYVLYERMPRLSVNMDSSKQRDKTKKTTTEIIRTDDKGEYACTESYAELCMEIEGHEWVIKRGRKLSGNKKSHSPIIDIKCDGEPFNSRKVKEPNELIVDLIGMDFEPFCNSVFFAQKDVSKLFVSTPKGRIDAILNVLGVLADINAALEVVRARKSATKEEVNRLEGKVSVLQEASSQNESDVQTAADSLSLGIKEHDIKIAKQESGVAESEASKGKLISERETKRLQIKDLEAERSRITLVMNAEKSVLQSSKESFEREAKEEQRKDAEFVRQKALLKQEWDKHSKTKADFNVEESNVLAKRIEDAKKQITDLEDRRKVIVKLRSSVVEEKGKLRSRLEQIDEEIAKYVSVVNMAKNGSVRCPYCSSVRPESEIRQEIKLKEEKRLALLSELKDASKRIAGQDVAESNVRDAVDNLGEVIKKETGLVLSIDRYETAVRTLAELGQKAADLRENYAKAKGRSLESINLDICGRTSSILEVDGKYSNQFKEFDAKLNSEIQAVSALGRSIDALLRTIGASKIEVGESMRQRTQLQLQLRDAITSLATLRKFKEDLSNVRNSLEVRRNLFARILMFEEMFGSEGVKTRIVDIYLPVFNNHLADFISILTNGRMSVHIEKSTMEPVIRGASSSIYEMLSGGEQDVIRLAANLALGMVSLGSSRSLPETLFLDEVFGSLAPAVQERVFVLLKHLRFYFGRILLITHNPELRNRFSATLRVEKNGGISSVSIRE